MTKWLRCLGSSSQQLVLPVAAKTGVIALRVALRSSQLPVRPATAKAINETNLLLVKDTQEANVLFPADSVLYESVHLF